jgi:hypothetical protein|tara:strand:+ start:2225 stop:2353 length:129 start_codon:yes stop_codon:yes gene_type:complete
MRETLAIILFNFPKALYMKTYINIQNSILTPGKKRFLVDGNR